MELTHFDLTQWTALPIVKFPHPVLKEKTEEVTAFDEDLKTLVHQMLVSMYYEPGCGLSANQVGISKRLFVTDTDFQSEVDEKGQRHFTNMKPRVFINPRFKEMSGEQMCEEGCLSFPGIAVEVKRAKEVVVEFEGLDGKTRTLKAEDFFADCLQHEYDHLEGITFLDYLPASLKQLYTRKFLKSQKK